MTNSVFRVIDFGFTLLFTFIILPTHSYSLECYSKSPSIQQGKGAHDLITTRKLTHDEYLVLGKLLKDLEGRWIGHGRSIGCSGKMDNVTLETKNLKIESECKLSNDGRFLMVSNISLPENKTNHQKTTRLYLKNEILSSTGFYSESDIELITVLENELTYMKKTRRLMYKSKQTRMVYETVTSIKKTGESSFVLDQIIYLQGMLKAKNVWNFIRK